jgi:DNA-binding winged helix-turn-helix (wHTH) protein
MNGKGSASRIEFGTVTLIPDERLVLKDGQPVPFTPKAFDLLAELAKNPGRLLTKEHLMQAVWPDTTVEESNLTYHIFAIRKALGENGDSGPYIETVPKRGYRFVATVRGVVDDADSAQPTATTAASSESASDGSIPPHRRRGLKGGMAVAGFVALGALLVLGLLRARPVEMVPLRFQEPVVGRLSESGMFSVSPDGRRLVFAASGADGIVRLWMRDLSVAQPAPLPGAEVFTIVPPAVWSPDSRFVAYDPGWVLKKVGTDGGTPQTGLRAATDCRRRQLEWRRRCAARERGRRVGAVFSFGGTRDDRDDTTSVGSGATHLSVVPLGRSTLHLSAPLAHKSRGFGIYAGELGTTSPNGGKRLLTTGFGAAFVAPSDAGPGGIVFSRDGILFVQRLDERRIELVGDPVRLADGIGSFLDGAFFSVSPKTLVYRAAEPAARLTWLDREGKELGRVETPGRFTGLGLSPDGTRALASMTAPQGTASEDLWLFDLTRSGISRRITFGPEIERSPLWVTNDRFVYAAVGGTLGVFQQTVAGAAHPLFESKGTGVSHEREL